MILLTEEILLAYGLPKETLTGCYNNALQEHESNGSLTWCWLWFLRHCYWSLARRYISAISVYNQPWLCTMNVNSLIKENGSILKKKPRSTWYPTETMMDADYTDGLVLLTNTPAQARPVGWGRGIHRLLFCWGVRLHLNKCPGYDTKQSDGEVPVMLELWGMRSTFSLLPGPLWPGVVALDRVLFMG